MEVQDRPKAILRQLFQYLSTKIKRMDKSLFNRDKILKLYFYDDLTPLLFCWINEDHHRVSINIGFIWINYYIG